MRVALFLASELAALLARPVDDAQYSLAHEITADIIGGEVGARLTDPPQPGVKAVALALAARVLTNPGGVRSEQAGGLLISYADAQTGAGLSTDERRRLRRAVGVASGASSLDIAPEDVSPCVRVWQAL